MKLLKSQLESYSVETIEIMGSVPHWVFRWGILVMVIVFGVVLGGSCFFRYPDVVQARIVVTKQDPPVSILSPKTGIVEQIHVVDKQTVEKGTIIAILKSPANSKDMFHLKDLLEKMQIDVNQARFSNLKFNSHFQLGGVQRSFESLNQSLMEYEHFADIQYHQNMVQMLKSQIQKQEKQFAILNKKISNYKQDIQLSEKQHERNLTLWKEKLLSSADIERSKSELLMKKNNLESTYTTYDDLYLRISNLNKAILDQELQQKQSLYQIELRVRQNLDLLLSEIALWEDENVIRAPIHGAVSIHDIWYPNQHVSKGNVVMTLVPIEVPGEHFIAKMKIPRIGSAKVKPGQKVKIMFDSYPSEEYGLVFGTIKGKTLVSVENEFSVEVILPGTLTTTYGVDLGFEGELTGFSQIITDNQSLFSRVFQPFRSIALNRDSASDNENLVFDLSAGQGEKETTLTALNHAPDRQTTPNPF